MLNTEGDEALSMFFTTISAIDFPLFCVCYEVQFPLVAYKTNSNLNRVCFAGSIKPNPFSPFSILTKNKCKKQFYYHQLLLKFVKVYYVLLTEYSLQRRMIWR
jgi:hypothetical protein